jgi:hypothetical protein
MGADQVPDVVVRVAAERGLGGPRPAPRPSGPGDVTLSVLASLVICGVAAVLVVAGWWFWFGCAVCAALGVAAGAFWDWRAARDPGRSRIFLFEHGLVRVRQDVVTVFGWDDVEYVERAHYSPSGQGGGSWSYSYRMRPRGGDVPSELELPGSSAGVAAGTAEAASRRARETIGAGGEVRFGPFRVGPEGLATEERSLLWHEIDRAVRTPQFVQVHERGRRRILMSAPIGTVPDARALVEVVNERARIAFRPE